MLSQISHEFQQRMIDTRKKNIQRARKNEIKNHSGRNSPSNLTGRILVPPLPSVRNKIRANPKVGYLRLGDIKSLRVICAIVKRQASESPFPFMQRRDFLSGDSFWSKVFAVK